MVHARIATLRRGANQHTAIAVSSQEEASNFRTLACAQWNAFQTRTSFLADRGVTKKQSHNWQKLAGLDEEVQAMGLDTSADRRSAVAPNVARRDVGV